MEDTLLQSKDLIKQRRESLGLTQKEFAFLLNLKDSGDRTISGWERGEHSPTDAKLKIIRNLSLVQSEYWAIAITNFHSLSLNGF